MKLYWFCGVKTYHFNGDEVDAEFTKLAICDDDETAYLNWMTWTKTLGLSLGGCNEIDEVDRYRIIVGEKVK